jgi:hypothetical protein
MLGILTISHEQDTRTQQLLQYTKIERLKQLCSSKLNALSKSSMPTASEPHHFDAVRNSNTSRDHFSFAINAYPTVKQLVVLYSCICVYLTAARQIHDGPTVDNS